ncbi:MAG: hypothetical protein QGI21_07010 [Candidatus Poseidoniaceae archaeon]|jgi:hypothetical protein|nr:hypothetical protein [Candidatus Poseidoniaceae archaeon]
MGIRDWFRPKDKSKEKPVEAKVELLPDSLDTETLIVDALATFEEDDEELEIEEILDPRPEYDSGDVEPEDVLKAEMKSNYELNVVENQDHEDLLHGAEIVGDISEEVEI